MKHLNQLKPLYMAAFMQAFIMWYAIEKLFMREIGFSDASIAISIAIMTATTLLVETPSGILADRWSRKGVLILSNVVLILGTLIASLSTGVLSYTLALVLIGIYLGLYSGIYDSIIYDATIEEDGRSKRYKKRYGVFQALSGTALVGSSIVGSLVSQMFGLQWAYWLTIPFAFTSCILLLFFKEPRLHATRHQSLGDHIISSGKTLLKPNVRLTAAATIIVGVVMGFQFNFSQLWYLAISLPILFYGPAYAALQACLAFGGIAADRVKLGPVHLVGLFTLSTLALTIPNAAVIVAGQITLQTTLVIVMIWLSGSIHDEIDSGQRSGINSVMSTFTKIGSLSIGLLFGYFSQEYSVFSTPIIIGILLLLLVTLLIPIQNRPRLNQESWLKS